VVGRTSVSDRQTFPGKPGLQLMGNRLGMSAAGQLTRPTQPFILSHGSINE